MSAFKLPITELLGGAFQDGVLTTRSGFMINRAWIAGIITQKRADKFLSLLVDDGTGSLRVRVFDDPSKHQVELGDIIEAAGYIREYNGRIYIVPDFMKKIDPNTELLRRLEALNVLEQLKTDPPTPPEPRPRTGAGLEQQAGEAKTGEDLGPSILACLATEKTITQLCAELGKDEQPVGDALETLLDNGEVFEPRPGKYLAI